MRKMRVIYIGDDELHHCIIGTIVNEDQQSITIEHVIADSVTGRTGLVTIAKSQIKDMSYRD